MTKNRVEKRDGQWGVLLTSPDGATVWMARHSWTWGDALFCAGCVTLGPNLTKPDRPLSLRVESPAGWEAYVPLTGSLTPEER